MNFLLSAGFPQIKKSTFWPLRDSRKSKKALFGACGIPANQEKHFLAFAGAPQIEKRTFWHLRDSRKRKKNVLAFAGLPQAFTK